MDADACNTLRTRESFYYLNGIGANCKYLDYLKGKMSRDDFYKLVPNGILNSVICETMSCLLYTSLLRMEHGDYEAEDFMKEITEMISGLVQNYDAVKGAKTLMSDHKRVGACSCCQADVLEKQKGWFCSNKDCRFVLWKDNAFFKSIGKHLSSGMVEKLLSDGRIRLKDCCLLYTSRCV